MKFAETNEDGEVKPFAMGFWSVSAPPPPPDYGWFLYHADE